MELETLQLETGLSIAGLAREAKIDRKTIDRALAGETIQKVKAAAVARALTRLLGRQVSIDDLGIKYQ